MPLDEKTAAEVLSLIKSSSVEQKLVGIEEAQKMFKGMFYEGMQLGDFARNAQVIENLYNIIRDELKQGFKILIDAAIPEDYSDERPLKKAKVGIIKKKKKPTMDEMMSVEFMSDIFGLTQDELKARLEAKKQ